MCSLVLNLDNNSIALETLGKHYKANIYFMALKGFLSG